MKTTNTSFKRLIISFVQHNAELQLVVFFLWYKMAELS